MTTKEALDQVIEGFEDERLREVLEFARFLHWREEREDWRRFGLAQFAKAYGPDEPEYHEADVKSDLAS